MKASKKSLGISVSAISNIHVGDATRSFSVDANPNKINAAKNLMAQALDIFSHRELDEILEFMERAANDLQMPCEEPQCPGTHWEIVRAN